LTVPVGARKKAWPILPSIQKQSGRRRTELMQGEGLLQSRCGTFPADRLVSGRARKLILDRRRRFRRRSLSGAPCRLRGRPSGPKGASLAQATVAPSADGGLCLGQTMSLCALGLPCACFTARQALPFFGCGLMRFRRLCREPARLRGGSSAWHAGLTAHDVPGAVAVMDLGKSPLDRHQLAVRAGGHVTAGQHTRKHVRGRLELETQDICKSAFLGFDDGT
jgi:hypothetical protein